MSDLTANDSSSFGDIGLQNVTRPKFQPIRLKALLHFCESDEDDDDESEDNPRESEDESEPDEPQPLPQDDFIRKPSPHKASINIPKVDQKDKDRLSGITRASSEEGREVAINVSSAQDRVNRAGDREERKVNDVNPERISLSAGDPNKLENYSFKHEEKVNMNKEERERQEYHSATVASKWQQTDAVHERSSDIVLLPSALSVHKRDYSAKSDANKGLQSMSGVRSHRENAYMPDMLNRRKEEHAYGVSVERKRLVAGNSESYLLNLSKEDQRHKSARSFIEQAGINRDEEFSRKSSCAGSESANCVSQITSENPMYPAAKYNMQYGIGKYEANERYATAENARAEFSTPSLSDTGRSLSAINRLVIDTPLKHVQAGSTHPNPCTSHKQLFCTPRNKLSGDPSKNHVQTPATILSSWSDNIRQTPVDGKNLIAKDRARTPRNTVYTPIIGKREATRYFGMDAKNARWPLADATLAHNDASSTAYPLESKPLILQTRSEVKCVTSEPQQEDRSKKTVVPPEVKLTQIEANYDIVARSTNTVEETKENQQPSIPDAFLENSRKSTRDKKENQLVIIGPDAGLKVIQDPSRKYNDENNVVPSAERKNSHDCYTGRERKREELRQIVDKVADIQFTVPSSVPPQRQGNTLFVKDREYLTLGTLGQGMSGEVLRVQDLSCGELRAIKCVDLSKMDKESAQGCLDEISLLRKLQAPCVVRMFDYHIRESIVYVVMEMGDTDLSRLLKSMSQEKRIPLTMILYYWTEMLTAVKHIHDNGVIHSDLKPANFLLVRGRLKLIDFGIASNINSDMTSVLKNNAIGTLNYISPEALMDIGGSADSPTHNVKYKISFKSDVWSLGCILYSLVYGHTPFHHIRSQWAKVNAITNPKPNISFPTTTFSSEKPQNNKHTPPVLIDVMRKCLLHDPKARPTVSQLLQVQYVPTKQDAAPISMPDIPANVLVKIKHALTEEEWRQLVQVLDIKRHHM